jgi:hypothetical protein
MTVTEGAWAHIGTWPEHRPEPVMDMRWAHWFVIPDGALCGREDYARWFLASPSADRCPDCRRRVEEAA